MPAGVGGKGSGKTVELRPEAKDQGRWEPVLQVHRNRTPCQREQGRQRRKEKGEGAIREGREENEDEYATS